MLSDALMEPTSDYRGAHNIKKIMSMCKVSATMKVSRLSAKAKPTMTLTPKQEW